MPENKPIHFTNEIKQFSKTALTVISLIMLLLGIGALIASIILLFTDIPAITILTFIITIILFGLAHFSWKEARALQLYKQYLEFREEDIYFSYENYTENRTVEYQIPYDQVKTIYLARGTHRIYRSNGSGFRMMYPILLIEWVNGEKLDYLAQGMGPEIMEVLEIIPKTIPLQALEYDLAPIPTGLLPKVIETSELIDVDRFKQPVDFPFPIAGRVRSLPKWVSPEKREERAEGDKRSKRIVRPILILSSIVFFFLSLIVYPSVEIDEGVFEAETPILLSMLSIIVLFLVMYIQHSLIFKEMYPIKKLLLPLVLVAGSFFIGGFFANMFWTLPDGFMDAVIVQVVLTIMVTALTYVVYLVGGLVIMLIGGLLRRR